MLQFYPAIYQDNALYELPRPVRSMRFEDGWDYEQLKVPLRDGDRLVGHSTQGVEITLEGEIGSREGTLKLTEEEMLAEIFALREKLDVSNDSDKYSFIFYRDSTAGTYRRFKSCSTVRFEYDISSPVLYTYSLTIHAEDSTLYQTNPASD